MSVLALELGLIRVLSLRFWYHFAYMVIGVAMLGFGASGTVLTLLRRRILARPALWIAVPASAFSLSIPLSLLASRHVPLDLEFLAWHTAQLGNLLLLEMLMFVPFFIGAVVIGVALMDRPERVTGHYVANLVGSGAGALAAVAAMCVLSTTGLLVATAAVGYLAAAVMLPWRRPAGAIAGVLVAAAVAGVSFCAPYEPVVSPYKKLSQLAVSAGTQVIHRAEGPLGRIDVVAGPALHEAPGLNPESMLFLKSLPPHVLLLIDGEELGAVYDCRRPEDWAFMDYTTAALPYALRSRPRVLIIGAGGGADIGLALFHESREIVALERNRQIVETMTGRLADVGGAVYRAKGLTVVEAEARGYLSSSPRQFDIIQVPSPGASEAGLRAGQESYLYTEESFALMLDHLSNAGLLCVSASRQTPPRDELRVLDTAAAALRRRGLDPRQHIAMIRNLFAVTVVASKRPFTQAESAAIRALCKDERRLFDLCYLPGLAESEANVNERLDRPYYFQAACALLGADGGGAGRKQYLADYVFDVSATSDDKPYFFHFFRWRSLDVLTLQLGRHSRAFLELGYFTLIAALGQAVVVAALMILLPLAPGIKALKGAAGRAAAMAYFLAIGAGFMLLEMGFLQKLVLYLAHPIYSAAVVISSFLVFAGLGSLLSRRWRGEARRTAAIAGATAVVVAAVYALLLHRWLALTQAQAMPLRFLIAGATIAPLALAMGHMFPLALRQVGMAQPSLVPWTWAANGFASVVATVAAPLIAMHWGFSVLTLAAVVCYAVAAAMAFLLPRGTWCPKRPGELFHEEHA
jgi:spermidine synthase